MDVNCDNTAAPLLDKRQAWVKERKIMHKAYIMTHFLIFSIYTLSRTSNTDVYLKNNFHKILKIFYRKRILTRGKLNSSFWSKYVHIKHTVIQPNHALKYRNKSCSLTRTGRRTEEIGVILTDTCIFIAKFPLKNCILN